MSNNKSVISKIGMGFIVLAIISPLVGFAVPFFNLPAATTTALVAFFVVGGPEVFLIIGAALAGKEAVQVIKSKLFRSAGKARYQFGLFLLVVSILCNWVFAYIDLIDAHELSLDSQLIITLCFDVVSIISILIMGPEFFEKIMRLARWEGLSSDNKTL